MAPIVLVNVYHFPGLVDFRSDTNSLNNELTLIAFLFCFLSLFHLFKLLVSVIGYLQFASSYVIASMMVKTISYLVWIFSQSSQENIDLVYFLGSYEKSQPAYPVFH